MNITANLSTAEKMSFDKAIELVHRSVELDAHHAPCLLYTSDAADE